MTSCQTCGPLPSALETRLNSIDETLRILTSLLLPIAKSWDNSSGGSSETLQASSLRSSSEWYPIPANPTPQAELPDRIWERIFRNLNTSQLSQVRQTCRRWKRLVDGCPELVEKFEVTFTEGSILDRDYRPEHLLPVCGATLRMARIVSVETWWTPFGANLSRLKLSECKISLAALVGMLREVPNLKLLELIEVACAGICNRTENFRLAKLERLAIEGSESGCGLLNVFGQLCTGLREFKLLVELTEDQSERRVIRFLQSVRNTLEDVEIFATAEILHELTAFKRLKKASFSNWFGVDELQLVEFARKQSNLEEFHIPEVIMKSETLHEIGNRLPSLKRLTVKIDSKSTVLPTFLNETPNLTHLSINGLYATHQQLNLTSHGTDNLTELKLSNVQLTCCSLQRFCARSPNIRVVELKSCLFESWSEIFTSMEQCRQLERLRLDRIRVNRNVNFLVQYFDNLRFLELSDCKLSKEMLATLFRLCPRLEEVYLWRMANFDSDVMLTVCQKLKKLTHLTFNDCLFTDDFANYIVDYCQTLERLSIIFCDDELSNNTIKLLQTTRNIQLTLK